MEISPTDIQILFTNYDITYFLYLAFCSEHFISIKHRILATFNINKNFDSDSLYAFKYKLNFPWIIHYEIWLNH
jgi:hypothetical protein